METVHFIMKQKTRDQVIEVNKAYAALVKKICM